MKFTLYKSNVVQKKSNCIYKEEVLVDSLDKMLSVIKFDHVCAKYKLNYRAMANFESSDVVIMDCDNDHSEEPSEWIDTEKFNSIFKDVNYVLVYSRNHLKQKGDKTPRPRFHVYFTIEPITSADGYASIKKRIYNQYPFFDGNALDSARFVFATSQKEIIWHEGSVHITNKLTLSQDEENFFMGGGKLEIKEGSRNSKMSQYAAKVLKKYGNTEEAKKAFHELAEKCTPPLDDSELSTIWNSALKFYNSKVVTNEGYVSPEVFNEGEYKYKPLDDTDVGQARVFTSCCKDIVRYSPATDYIVYNNCFWEESKVKAQGLVHTMTDKQLAEAQNAITVWRDKLKKTGLMAVVESGSKDAMASLPEESKEAVIKYFEALSYEKYALKMRSSKNISATLTESKPMVEINHMDLDKDEFLLNTPTATYDLRLGIDGAKNHNPSDFITKCTKVPPNNEGMDLWVDALNKIFNSDSELIEYVQKICGLACIGKVYVEALIIAYGEGGNGKSTFWNSIARVLGTYYGKISADILTVNCKRNVKPEMAEIKGKRILIAAESKEGARLDDAIVKELCSTDDIGAEKKYKDPFKFKPCHTLVLYTNHLPRVSAQDDGIWRRLIVIPFTNKLTGNGDIKNYSDFLVDNAGGAILTWLIEGAKKVITDNYKIVTPKCVQASIDEYKEQNDWFHHFIEDVCELDEGFKAPSALLYSTYRTYCQENGEYARSTADFYNTLQKNGYSRIVEKRVKYIKGLRIRSVRTDFDDAFSTKNS